MKFPHNPTISSSQVSSLNRVKLIRIVFSHSALRSMVNLLSLATVFLLLSLITLTNSTAKTITAPIFPPTTMSESSIFSTSVQLHSAGLQQSNPVATAFISAVPGSDGKEIFISMTGVEVTGSPVFLNIDPGSGPSGHQDSRAMLLSDTIYIATAIGFAPGLDIGNDNDDTMEITTTVGSQVMSTGKIKFQRAFVETSTPETIIVDDSNFIVDMPNLNTLPISEAYVLVMSTNAPPGSLPPGYNFASSTYNVSPSGALTESDKFMTLKLAYQEPLPNNSDPHTLAVIGWDRTNTVWKILGGDLFDDDNQNHLTYVTKRFAIYGLATTSNWRDSFKEPGLTGVSALSNTQWGLDEAIILSSGATSGSVTSIPITPTPGTMNWSTLHFSATIPLNTGLRVDLLDLNGNVVLANLKYGADLRSLSIGSYPSLKLGATLTSTTAGLTPELREWSLSWTPDDPAERKVYLPLVIKNGS